MEFKEHEELVRYLKKGIEQEQYPRTLYQFKTINSNTESIFNNDKLFFAPINKFNDPFECKYVLESNYSESDLLSYLNELAFNRNIQYEEIKLLFNVFVSNKEEMDQHVRMSIDSTFNDSGIGCFVEDFNNLLMWSHYADSHRGICIEYDILESLDTFISPIPVIYDDTFPVINYIKNRKKFLNDTISRKSSIWSYEKEFRILKKKHGLHGIKKESIKSITFGVNCSERDIEKMVSVLKDNLYTHIRLYKASIVFDKYELKRVEITSNYSLS